MGKDVKPLLSIGMIVKNEIRSLEKCLKALQPLRDAIPCELVIADTGSDDGTREVAARYADILFDFPWINDFAAARNAVMDRCSGKWYFSVDADEYLDPDISELATFLRGREADKITFGSVCQRNYATPDMKEDYSDFFAPRLLRLSSKLRYRGTIHESWVVNRAMGKRVFLHTILHHDGYALPSREARKQKLKRNMALLEKELERTPRNLRRLLQCVESGVNTSQKLEYVRRGLQVVKEKEVQWEMYGPSLYQRALGIALDRAMVEFDLWLEEARTLFPQALAIQIDGSFLAMAKCYKSGDYEGVLREAVLYWKGIEELYREQKKVGFEPSSLDYDTPYKQNQVRISQADACRRLKRFEEMKESLDAIEVKNCALLNVKDFVKTLYISWEKIDLSDTLLQVYQTLFEKEPADAERQAVFRRETASAFNLPETEEHTPPFSLIAKLPVDLGRAAKVMQAQTAEEAAQEAGTLESWQEIPPIVVQKLMDWNVPLPPAFFLQGTERYEELAAGLAERMKEKFTQAVLAYAQAEDFFYRSTRFTWLFDLVIAAVMFEDWTRAEPAETLCGLYAGLAADYLRKFYRQDLLCKEEIPALPAMHRFGWYYIQARNALAAGDKLEYVRLLRAGLQAAPGTKKMVEFLMERINSEAQSPQEVDSELQALAQKVQTVLAAFSPDDPAVAALLASPAYQKVKGLIQLPWEN